MGITAEGLNVVWFVDPMHGNTFKTKDGDKTRRYDDILTEIRQTYHVLKQQGQHLGGIHLELSGEDVTECVGGPQNLQESDLGTNWKSACDPRLNYHQSVELAREVSEMIHQDRAVHTEQPTASDIASDIATDVALSA